MQGSPLRQPQVAAVAAGYSSDQETVIRERLSGLGYIS
jgi:hypothetical protein